MKKRKGYLLSLSYTVRNGRTYISLIVKGKRTAKLYYQYDPYFLVDAPEEYVKDLKDMVSKGGEEIAGILDVKKTERIIGAEKKKLMKVVCREPRDVPQTKRNIPFRCYEFAIPFVRRFIFDFQLTPNGIIHYQREGRIIKKITSCEPATPELKTLAFDIETYNPLGAPRPKKDPIIMVSYSDGKKGVITYKKSNRDFVETVEDERVLLDRLSEIVKEEDPDVIFGYNSGNFDLPYISERSKTLKTPVELGRGGGKITKLKRGLIGGSRIGGRIHIDLYPIIRLFGFIGIIKTAQFTLDAVAREVLGKSKNKIKSIDMWKLWDEERVDDIAEYSLVDSEITKELGDRYLPLELELSSITKLPIFDTSLSTSGQLVENLLMFNCAKRKELVPQKPVGQKIAGRLANPIKGAFVKLPEPGIYDNIAVLDFRGLYPSIIVSYNIDPNMLVAVDEEPECHQSPTGARFRKSPKGLIPSVLDELIDFRAELKKKLKRLRPGSEDYRILSARSQAVKILSNSFYGYTVYARSRWYSRECGESVTAWGRQHITNTIDNAVKKGFQVLYADTDSVFLLYRKRDDVISFMDEINKELPEKMELELEGFYSRGVFVSKKGDEKGAKKKYALLGEDGRIKIRGFELVRRDWSGIARNTQLKVLEAILKEGSKEKAVRIVRETVERLRSGGVPLEELAIITQLNKDPKNYEIVSPELSAARKAMKNGVPLERGSVVSYVVTKKGKSISEKAYPVDMAKDYDPNYYVNNQVLPAVMKILKELGYDEYSLKVGGKQKGLNDFI